MRVLEEAAKRNVLLNREALELILSEPQPIAFLDDVLTRLGGEALVVGKNDVLRCLSREEALAPVIQKSAAPRNKRHADIRVVTESDITGVSTCEGKMADFARYFQNRYRVIRKILERRRELGGALPIERALRMDREVKLIVIVAEHSITKNGHRILTVEDETDSCKVLISKDSDLIGEIFLNDEVVGIVGKPTQKKDMIIASEIVRPDIPLNNPWNPSDSVSSVAFLGDVHVGSNTFLDKHWKRMVDWMKQNAEAMSLDYLVLPGDIVDGIGIYPDQEDELIIDDIFKQYEYLGQQLLEIPDHIKIVIQPGNHDAVRPAEPQPALAEVFAKSFDSNIIMAGNPVYLEIEGRSVLSYHGRSLDDWIASVQQLKYERPLEVMREMLRRRHLAPVYGMRTPLAPEKRDYMVIDRIPEIFVTGHVHGAHYEDYRDIRMINASTWQSQTDFQRMHNFNPDPAVMPIVHLGNGQVTMQSFS